MNQRAIIVASALFLIIMLGLLGFTYYMKSTLTPPISNDVPVVTKEVEVEKVRVNAVHVYANGEHTVLGEILTDSTCALLEAKATVTPGSPDAARIDVTTLKSADATCEQKPTPRRFIVDFKAGVDASITATLDGKDVILNLVEGDPSKTLKIDDDLYFKG